MPGLSFVILESRPRLGGTWDFYKYPGVRTDSDMYTMAYFFRPWRDNKTTASASAVNSYVSDTADEYDVTRHVRFNETARKARWSSVDSTWSVDVQHGDGAWSQITGSFILMCAGYTNFNHIHKPEFADVDKFQGKIVHPQTWPADLDCKDKKVVVIGSGATAITIVPALAKEAKHVTMLQRSPSYIFQVPNLDPLAAFCSKYLPFWLSNTIMRCKNIFEQQLAYITAVWWPSLLQYLLIADLRRHLRWQPDFRKHFTPKYRVLTQRLCLSPDTDFTDAITKRGATVVTDTIERFTPAGILLTSGQELKADVVVTATGFDLYALGGLEIEVDGVLVKDAARSCVYKGNARACRPGCAIVMLFLLQYRRAHVRHP
jgi:monooxygenase